MISLAVFFFLGLLCSYVVCLFQYKIRIFFLVLKTSFEFWWELYCIFLPILKLFWRRYVFKLFFLNKFIVLVYRSFWILLIHFFFLYWKCWSGPKDSARFCEIFYLKKNIQIAIVYLLSTFHQLSSFSSLSGLRLCTLH